MFYLHLLVARFPPSKSDLGRNFVEECLNEKLLILILHRNRASPKTQNRAIIIE